MDHQEDGHHGKEDEDEAVARLEEFKKSMETKMAFRLSNLNPERPDSGFLRTLDSSIKRNTAVIKKLKQINEEQRESLLDELRGVNLSKFVSEAASAIRDAKLRTTDIPAAVQICSLLHQRYTDFSPSLVQAFLKVFFPGKSGDELDADRKAMKKRCTLKLLVELYFVGVIEDVGVFINIIKDLTSIENLKDRDATQWNLSLLSSFARQGRIFLGLPLSGQEIYDEFFKGFNITTEQTKIFRRAFHTYYDAAAQLLLSEYSSLRQMEHDNSKIIYAKGELNEENATLYEKLRKSYDHIYRGVSSLAEALDMLPPVMPEDSNTTRVTTGEDVSSASSRKDSPVIDSIWDDDDTRAFYECLPDLRAFVPAVLLGEAESNVNEQSIKVNEQATELAPEVKQAEVKTQESTDASADPDFSQEGKISEKGKAKEEKDKEREKGKEKNADRKGESEKERLKGLDGTNLDALLQRLPGCVSRDLIDHLTVEFCYLNSKSSRKRLVKALFNVPRTSLELLSYYSRMVATLSTCMKDVSSMILQMLEEEFNFLINKKDQMNIETKIKNIRFLGELCKFKIAPAGLIFSCLKACLDDFSHHNIDVACNLLETCGRFLYRCPETSIRMTNMLEILMRLKNVKNLDPRHSTHVENAYYFCKPPERSAHITKVRPPLHQYIRKLLFSDLDKSSIEHVLRQLRKLPWDDCEPYLLKCFMKVHKGKYGQIHLIASLTAGLSRYHDDFAVAVVDEVLEEIRFGLESSDYGMHQRRLAHMRFLGELYNYEQLDSSVIFDTLYLILVFNHGTAEEIPDPSEDYFCIRMVITLLETCGHYFDRGSSKRKLDRFLIYFQRYIFSKGDLPLDIEFDLQDIFADLRPDMTWYSSIEEANAALIELEEHEHTISIDNKIKTEKHPVSANGVEENGEPHEEAMVGDSDSDSRSDSIEQEGHGGEEDLDELNHNDESVSEDDDNEEEDEIDDAVQPPFDEEDEVHVRQMVAKVDPQEEADFDREFKALMLESLESRKLEVRGRTGLNMTIPMKVLEGGESEETLGDSDGCSEVVKVLMKRGNKQQTKQMCIPRDCSLVQSAKEKEAAELEEKQDIKRLILEYNEREEEEMASSGGGFGGANLGVSLHVRGGWGRGGSVGMGSSSRGGGSRQRLQYGFSGGGGGGGLYYRRK